jgi:hypothetical protein
MTPYDLLFATESLLVAFGIGATLWFFFVQTPALLLGLGMERFLPLQMRLVRVFAKALAVSTVLVLVAAALRGASIVPAAVAAAAAVTNALFVVPRALRSGGQALREVRAEEVDDATLASFTSVGGGEPTKVWHRIVVLAVLVMTGGLLVEGAELLWSSASLRP